MFITSLKNQKEFELINKLGKKLHEKYFILVIAKNLPKIFLESKYNIFLGIKVSRKLNKKAVIRNKIKRRIRHLIRLIVNSAPFACKKQRIEPITNRKAANSDIGESKSIDYIVNNSNLKIVKLAMIIIPRKGFDKADFSVLSYELSKTILDFSYTSKK